MSEYIFDVASKKGKIDWPGALQRSDAFPLDRSSVFSSLADAEKYISGQADDDRKLGATVYAGQIISVYDTTDKKVYPYIVQIDSINDSAGTIVRTLKRILLEGDSPGGDSPEAADWLIINGGTVKDVLSQPGNTDNNDSSNIPTIINNASYTACYQGETANGNEYTILKTQTFTGLEASLLNE